MMSRTHRSLSGPVTQTSTTTPQLALVVYCLPATARKSNSITSIFQISKSKELALRVSAAHPKSVGVNIHKVPLDRLFSNNSSGESTGKILRSPLHPLLLLSKTALGNCTVGEQSPGEVARSLRCDRWSPRIPLDPSPKSRLGQSVNWE
ncbi:hypothetical protein C0Q70_19113 [Pomacea canaliculata]|uniref:Uncharacterized protein n=1 Tax=Pomacea canaliculata TaxID=400727 RepID=A0A2T7NIE6_POMCA|nr:hypothetical protein C0Q70_19113 [Pomacea canaliculata]